MDVLHNPANPIDLHVGDRIRVRRQLLKMSITGAAVRLGVSETVFDEYEQGLLRVDALTLWRLSTLMGVKIRYFYDGLEGEAALPVARRVND